jgi:hypothetical protein
MFLHHARHIVPRIEQLGSNKRAGVEHRQRKQPIRGVTLSSLGAVRLVFAAASRARSIAHLKRRITRSAPQKSEPPRSMQDFEDSRPSGCGPAGAEGCQCVRAASESLRLVHAFCEP